MGGGLSCDSRECTWCCDTDKVKGNKTKSFCSICRKKLEGDIGSISNYCSHCKILDPYDENGFYHYRTPIFLPWPHIEFTA